MHSNIEKILDGNYDTFFLMSGPCVVESYDNCMLIAEHIISLAQKLSIPYVFKASFKKANRTKLSSFSTIGVYEAVEILYRVKNELDVPVVTDIHETLDVDIVKDVVDIIQIPAFLCRQTDLISSAAKSGLPINIKKGQFISSDGMKYATDKVRHNDNNHVFITERGNSFGYTDLVVDFRNIPVMRNFCTEVIMDCTHATQRPNRPEGTTGGNPNDVEYLARAAISVGARGLFIETHNNPAEALSDGANVLPLQLLGPLLERISKLSMSVRNIYD